MKLTIGDRVAYSVQFLKSIGMSHSNMAFAKGKITYLNAISLNFILATIQWEGGAEMPEKVAVANLAKVGPNRRYANCD